VRVRHACPIAGAEPGLPTSAAWPCRDSVGVLGSYIAYGYLVKVCMSMEMQGELPPHKTWQCTIMCHDERPFLLYPIPRCRT
jgi:hypothetical protein